ncbi:uncharacterized protein LOC144504767 [Mustelus asterias]
MPGPPLSALTLTLCMAVGLGTNPILIQSPGVVKVLEGGTVQIHCALQSSNVNYRVEKYTVHWYHPQNKSQILLSHFPDGRFYHSEGFSERFQLSRDVTSNSYNLTIRDVQLSDSNVYLCGIWGYIFGSGTRLNVTSANVPVLTQSPSVERVTEGQTARLQCTMGKAAVTDTDVHWHRELPGKDRERVLTQDTGNHTHRSPGFTERFQPSRDTSNNSFILTITMVQPSDTAVYYCSVWGDISGNGTQLNVTTLDVGVNGELRVVWISLGVALGAFLIAGAILLLWIRRARVRKQRLSSSLQTSGPDYENIPRLQCTGKSGHLQVDANQIYMNVSPRSKAASR